MAAIEDVVTSSSVGLDGNSYTTSISNDKLTNEDFLKLMLEEMKQQDPTKPMDSAALMDTQLKMSTIQSNQDMASAMSAMQSAYQSSALSTAASVIGHVVEDGSVGDDGLVKSFKVTATITKQATNIVWSNADGHQTIGIIHNKKM